MDLTSTGGAKVWGTSEESRRMMRITYLALICEWSLGPSHVCCERPLGGCDVVVRRLGRLWRGIGREVFGMEKSEDGWWPEVATCYVRGRPDRRQGSTKDQPLFQIDRCTEDM